MGHRMIIAALALMAAVILVLFDFRHINLAFSRQDPIVDFERAKGMINCNRDDEAIALLNRIVQENPGTPVSALCHFQLAEIYGYIKKDRARMLQEYQTIIEQFPGTSYECRAKAEIIFCNYLRHGSQHHFDSWLAKIDELMVEYGGISVGDIFKGNSINNNSIYSKLKAAPREYICYVFPQHYHDIASRLHSCKSFGANRNNYIVEMDIFIRSFFPKYYKNDAVLDDLKTILMEGHNNLRFVDDTTPPAIEVVTPEKGHCTGYESPLISIILSDGDILQSQISLPKLQFTLDGQDISGELRVRSCINRYFDDRGNGHSLPVFEKLKIEYTPSAPVNCGRHTVYVRATDLAGNTAEKSWSFTVR